ncbi:MAG: Flp pilus assembly complex ATPase component TadA [Candidatus Omnitrophica bacterium]|nr:Flp pilus assembly complex ATPase component TadA [Candidatus Omnitrophota bacterium]
MAKSLDSVLVDVLIEQGLITRELVDPLIPKAQGTPGGLGVFLVQRGIVPEDSIMKVYTSKFGLSRVDLTKTQIVKNAIERVPLKVAEYYHLLPIKLEARKLTVAVAAPLDTRTQDAVQTLLSCEIEMVLAREQEIIEGIKKWYGLGAGTIEKILETAPGEEKIHSATTQAHEKVEEIEKQAEEASVIKLVNQILLDAYQKRATDIHVEPYRGKLKVRYRIDGVLYNTNVPQEIRQFILSIVSRIKIMANLNIIEKRLPQDGRAIVKISGDTLDLRISSIPTPSGESIVIRLLPMKRLFSLEKLGLDKSELTIFDKLIEKPHGIILITGPTGSGKSTTLYACLSMINTEERKIITIEDPVEYEMEGVTQIQVLPSIGLDFAKGLRSVLRHDPDVIMVGEIRDLETAEIAARVALTGHLVFSTLHTNDAASGVTRLIDIGVEPYLVSSSVEAFIAQRLVRTICEHCKEEDKSQSDEIKVKIARELNIPSYRDVTLCKGKGCEKCNFTGFWGRVAIFEVLIVDDRVRELIMKRIPAGEIARYAISKGMRTLRQSGWQKVIAGYTTPEEILEVAPEEIRFEEKIEEGAKLVESSKALSKLSEQQFDQAKSKAIRTVDRRAFIRLDVQVTIRYRVLSLSDLEKKNLKPEQYSVTKNLSAGGLVFEANEQLKISSILELEIELPKVKETIACHAKTVRVMETEQEGKFDIAVCFLDLSGADRAKLDQFVKDEIS